MSVPTTQTATEPTQDEPTEPEQPKDDATSPKAADGDDADLGEGGKRALTSERRARSKAERERDALRAELDQFREASKSEQERALDAARREGFAKAEAEWKKRWRTERVSTAALQALQGRVSDPRLAMPHLNLSDDLMNDDGDIDTDVLTEAVDALLDEFPALAAPGAATTARHHGDIGPKRTPRKEVSANELLRIALRGR